MGLIRLTKVISYSSQDGYFKADNLLLPCGSQKPWLCSSEDRSGCLIGEFEMEQLSCIHFIDIGNFGSATIEIQVCRSNETEYQTLLPAVTLLSALDVKRNVENTGVCMYDRKNMDSKLYSEDWKRIRIICCQPFKKMQFGLHFIELRFLDIPIPFCVEENRVDSDFAIQPISDKRIEDARSRGLKIVAASHAKSASYVQKKKDEEISFFKEVETFLSGCVNESNVSMTPKEYLLEFERQRRGKLKPSEKRFFMKKYVNILNEVNKSDSVSLKNYEEFEREPRKVVFSSGRKSPGSEKNDSNRVDTPGSPQPSTSKYFHESQASTSQNIALVNCPICGDTFSQLLIEKHSATCGCPEIEYIPQKKNKSVILDPPIIREKRVSMLHTIRKKCDENLTHSPDIEEILIVEKDLNANQLNGNKQMLDKIQMTSAQPSTSKSFNGTQPSTSRGDNSVECPICGDEFPRSIVERHSSTCGDIDLLILKRREEERPAQKGMVNCPICGDSCYQSEINSHIDDCVTKGL